MKKYQGIYAIRKSLPRLQLNRASFILNKTVKIFCERNKRYNKYKPCLAAPLVVQIRPAVHPAVCLAAPHPLLVFMYLVYYRVLLAAPLVVAYLAVTIIR